ncbi:MAG TPA: hypothetical protein VLS96_00690 [Nodosilinea sp.]|nr:hypothetical protein [Nodosilinea sp.]
MPRFSAPWLTRLKPLGRWVVVGAAIAFLLHTLIRHRAEVATLRIAPQGWSLLLIALGITLLAHLWAGWVWSWVLQALQQPVSGAWSALTYLQTNLLKYLPGNVWHFYGRVRALKALEIDNGSAIIGVALEPLLMAAAALILGLATPTRYWPAQLILLGLALALLAPRHLNPLVQRLGQAKAANLPPDESFPSPPPSPSPSTQNFSSGDATRTKLKVQNSSPTPPPPHSPTPPLPPGLSHYPLKPLLGQIGYVLLRGLGFALVLSVVTALPAAIWPSTISAFSLAWLAGLVVPGAPGGLGVFEAIALALLQETLAPGAVLSGVVLYRLVNTLAEALGAALATLEQGLSSTLK